MSLTELLASALVSEPFYVVQPTNDEGKKVIKNISVNEAIAYFLKRGHLPTRPKVTFVGSGGSAKGYYVLGFVKRLYELGIKIDQYIVTSVSSLIAVLEVTKDLKAFEEFALELPNLIQFHKTPRHLGAIRIILPKKYREPVMHLINMLRSEEVTINGENESEYVITVNRGVVDTLKLEDKLRMYCGNMKVGEFDKVKIIATDYSRREAVVLNQTHPNMLLYRAIIASMSVPGQFRPDYSSDSIIVDGGVAYHFPFLPELLGDSTTIIAVRLGHPYKTGVVDNLGGPEGFFKNMQIQEEIRIAEMTKRLFEPFVSTTIEDLAQNRDTRKFKVYLDLPDLSDIPPLRIDIPPEKRQELIDKGYRAADRAIVYFRKPMFFR